MKNLIFIGPPGSGKGTQANVLKKHGYVHVSTGDLLRNEVESGSDLGARISDIISRGNLVSDEVVEELLLSRLDLTESKYIFDGFPRNLSQARVLKGILNDYPYAVVYFDANIEKIINRICSRRVAINSGEIYNLLTRPPKVEGICDVSGENLIHRDDDKESVVKNRFKIYMDSRDDLLEFYKGDEIIHVEGDLSLEQVSEKLLGELV